MSTDVFSYTIGIRECIAKLNMSFGARFDHETCEVWVRQTMNGSSDIIFERAYCAFDFGDVLFWCGDVEIDRLEGILEILELAIAMYVLHIKASGLIAIDCCLEDFEKFFIRFIFHGLNGECVKLPCHGYKKSDLIYVKNIDA